MTSYPKEHFRSARFRRAAPLVENSRPDDAIPISIDSMASLSTTGLPHLSTERTPCPSFTTTPNRAAQLQQLQNFTQCTNLPEALYDTIDNADLWEKAYVQHLQVCPNFDRRFRAAYLRGSLRSGSDGSAPFHGSFSWKIIDTTTGHSLAQGGGNCQHFPGLTSHRMEAAGMLGTDIFLSAVQHTMTLPAYESTIVHVCDNLEAVNRYNTAQLRHTTNFGIHDMDLHMAIASTQSHIPPRQAFWVKGHQDDTNNNINADAQLNVEVDELANLFYSNSPSFLPPPPIPQVYHGNIPITWNINRFLQRHHGEATLRQHIMDKHTHWTTATFDAIAWNSFQSAFKRLPEYERTRIIKYANGWSATATRMNDWDHSVDQRCPNCRHSN